jgi:hypothetical protein
VEVVGLLQHAGLLTLDAELQEAVGQFEELKRRCAAMVEGISLEQFNWRPSADRWSIAQNLDHLNREAREQVPVVEGLIERGNRERIVGEGPFRHPWFGNWYIGFLEPPYKVKVPTLQRFVPPSSLTFEAVVPECMAWHDRFIDVAYKANGLHLSQLKAKLTYLALGMPSLSLGQWLRYLAAHERRHLWQIERVVLGAEAFPRPY